MILLLASFCAQSIWNSPSARRFWVLPGYGWRFLILGNRHKGPRAVRRVEVDSAGDLVTRLADIYGLLGYLPFVVSRIARFGAVKRVLVDRDVTNGDARRSTTFSMDLLFCSFQLLSFSTDTIRLTGTPNQICRVSDEISVVKPSGTSGGL